MRKRRVLGGMAGVSVAVLSIAVVSHGTGRAPVTAPTPGNRVLEATMRRPEPPPAYETGTERTADPPSAVVDGDSTALGPVVRGSNGAAGRVVAESSGEGVGGGEVALIRAGLVEMRARIESDGRFRFPAVPDGPIELLARPAAHAPASIAIGAKDARDEIVIRVGRGATVVLVVVDAVVDRPVAGVAVVTRDPETGIERRATSRFDGRVEFVGLPTDDVQRLRCEVDGGEWLALLDANGGAVEPGRPAAVLRVVPSSAVEGVVRAAGTPVVGAHVHVRVAGRRWCRVAGPGTDASIDGEAIASALTTRTDEAGRYRLAHVPPIERLRVVVRAPARLPVDRELRLAPGEHRVLDWTLPDGFVVTGRVVDSAGVGMSEARVYVARRDRVVHRIGVDADGAFRLAGLPRTGYTLRAVAADGRGSARVRARDGAVQLRLRPLPPPIAGRVVDAAGRPCVGVTVEARPTAMPDLFDGEPFVTPVARTDERGRFAFDRLRTGWRYRIRAAAPDDRQGESGPHAPGCADLVLCVRPDARLIVGLPPDDIESGDCAIVVRDRDRVIARRACEGARRLSIDALPAGCFDVDAVDHDGITFASASRVEVRANQTSDVTLERRPTLDVFGLVVDRWGRPVAGLPIATLVERPDAESEPRRAVTDDRGRFRIRGLPEGCRDFVTGDPRRGFSIAPAIAAGPTAVRLSHAPTATLEVCVRSNADGRAVAGATVAFLSPGRGGGRIACNPRGIASWRTSPGPFAVIAAAPGFRPDGTRVVVRRAQDVTHVEIRLDPDPA